MNIDNENKDLEEDTEDKEPIAGDDDADDADPAIVQEAKNMGWRPKEEFNGDPADWRSADEFVRRGREIQPILQSQLKRSMGTIADLHGKLEKQEAEFSRRISRMEEMGRDALRRQRQQIESQYEGMKRAAAEDGDMDAYNKADAQKAKAISEFDKEAMSKLAPEEDADEGTPSNMTPSQQKTVSSWVRENPWFEGDDVLRAFAIAEHGRLLREIPGLMLEDNLQQVRDTIREKFPEKFGMDNHRSSSVEGGSRAGRKGFKGGKLAERLPREARQAAKEFIEEGLYKDMEEYAKVYFDQPGVE